MRARELLVGTASLLAVRLVDALSCRGSGGLVADRRHPRQVALVADGVIGIFVLLFPSIMAQDASSPSRERRDDNSLPVVHPTFDERYRAWAAAEAAIVEATASGAIHDADRLSALCADAVEKHRVLWAETGLGSLDTGIAKAPDAGRGSGSLRARDDHGASRKVIAQEIAMHSTDTSLHDLRDQVLADLRRDRARTRWIGCVALPAVLGAVTFYLSVF